MSTIEALTGCVRALNNISVPVGMMDAIGVPILAVRNTLKLEIDRLKTAEKEANDSADDPVQRAESEPEQH